MQMANCARAEVELGLFVRPRWLAKHAFLANLIGHFANNSIASLANANALLSAAWEELREEEEAKKRLVGERASGRARA